MSDVEAAPDEDLAPAGITASMNIFIGHLQAQIHDRIAADLDATLSEFREEIKRIGEEQMRSERVRAESACL